MTNKQLYTKGTKIWLPDPGEVWREATLLDDLKGDALKVTLSSGQKVKVKIHSDKPLPHLKNPDVLIGESDLTSLSYLHEPAVLHNLQVRFCDSNYIYTYCGIVLVALNPYQDLPLYGAEVIWSYRGHDLSTFEPHIFAIAEEAYKRMERFDEDQSIIVSGESGAGKTVSAKHSMRYFATVCGAKEQSEIERKVLATNPILESFGNAKTIRNDNSSRFGKYISICFSHKETITGAKMHTYLLEKSRVVQQSANERNYHIFYQLSSLASNPTFNQYLLDSAEEFTYTNRGCTQIDNVDDNKEFMLLCQALSIMGINQGKQSQMFKVLSGILHLGNVTFDSSSDPAVEGSQISKGNRFIETSSKLFGVEERLLRHWLCHKKIQSATETLTVPLTPSLAASSRDALSKHIYSQLFSWVVRQLNASLHPTSSKTKHFIGVLDIYGFESFELNSFEQFCINYANEKLQQQFCMHVFKLEQEEYVREGIKWTFIDFHDNQPCISLIEDKMGIIDLLVEECKMVNGSDENWCRKLYEKHSKHQNFIKPRMSSSSFVIRHFADDVEYDIGGFLDKNRDKIFEEQMNIFRGSEYELVAELFKEEEGDLSKNNQLRSSQRHNIYNSNKKQSKTVASQFSESLKDLMKTLFASTPHYIRCIKPNDQKTPFKFDAMRCVQQLRACGVLETVRISANGYPGRWTYMELFKRYRVLLNSEMVDRKNIVKTCGNIIQHVCKDQDTYQLGKTKVFMRAGVVAVMESLRIERISKCATDIQRVVRGWLCRVRWVKIKTMVLAVQTFARKLIAVRKATMLRRIKAATTLVSHWRAYKDRKQFQNTLDSVLIIQRLARTKIARKAYIEKTKMARILKLQRYIKCWYLRRKHKKVVNGVVKMQALVRRMIAKKMVKELKPTQTHTKTTPTSKGVGLESKVIQLQLKLDDKAKEVVTLKEEQEKNKRLCEELEKFKMASKSAGITQDHLQKLQEKIQELEEQVETERKEKDRVKVEKEAVRKEKNDIINGLNMEREMLKEQIETVNCEIKALRENQEEVCETKVQDATKQLQQQLQQERANHQRLLSEHNRLQQRLYNYQQDGLLDTPQTQKKRRGSIVSEVSNGSVSSNERHDVDSGIVNKGDLDIDKRLTKRNVSLVLKMQKMLQEAEEENRKLKDRIERKQFIGEKDALNFCGLPLIEFYEAFKLQEMELENARIRNQVSRLQKVLTESASSYDVIGGKTKQLFEQLEASKEELKHKDNQVARLKTLLVEQQLNGSDNNNLKKIDNDYNNNNNNSNNRNNKSGEMLLNEDGELNIAYESQKKLNRLLEEELQRDKQVWLLRFEEMTSKIDDVTEKNKSLEKKIREYMELSDLEKVERMLVDEVARVVNHNMALQKQLEEQAKGMGRMKTTINKYSSLISPDLVTKANLELETEFANEEEESEEDVVYKGMLEYKREDEEIIIRNLIINLRAESMLKEPPNMPAHILFMLVRYTDHINDEEMVVSLLENSIHSIKKVLTKYSNDIGRLAAWMSNGVKLLNLLRQFSGEEIYSEGTSEQQQQVLVNFDLASFRPMVDDLCVSIFQGVVRFVQSKISPLIVSAILEKEQVSSCSAGKPVRQASVELLDAPIDSSPADVIKIFDLMMQHLCAHNVGFDVINQLFKQIFYVISSTCLNSLLLRKDLCRWSKAVQIRYNMGQLEEWGRDKGLQTHAFKPLLQATQILQARKKEDDVDSICGLASDLNANQVVKLLNMYSGVEDFEEKVPILLIRKVQERLKRAPDDTLLLDTKQQFPVHFNFKPSNIIFSSVKPPSVWGLGFLKRI